MNTNIKRSLLITLYSLIVAFGVFCLLAGFLDYQLVILTKFLRLVHSPDPADAALNFWISCIGVIFILIAFMGLYEQSALPNQVSAASNWSVYDQIQRIVERRRHWYCFTWTIVILLSIAGYSMVEQKTNFVTFTCLLVTVMDGVLLMLAVVMAFSVEGLVKSFATEPPQAYDYPQIAAWTAEHGPHCKMYERVAFLARISAWLSDPAEAGIDIEPDLLKFVQQLCEIPNLPITDKRGLIEQLTNRLSEPDLCKYYLDAEDLSSAERQAIRNYVDADDVERGPLACAIQEDHLFKVVQYTADIQLYRQREEFLVPLVAQIQELADTLILAKGE